MKVPKQQRYDVNLTGNSSIMAWFETFCVKKPTNIPNVGLMRFFSFSSLNLQHKPVNLKFILYSEPVSVVLFSFGLISKFLTLLKETNYLLLLHWTYSWISELQEQIE